MTVTYEKIATTTLGSAASSVTFSSISNAYTDIVLICSIANTVGQADVRIRLNGDTATNYSYTQLFGTGSAAGSNRSSNNSFAAGGYIGTTQSNSIVHFQNYSNTTTNKSILARYNDTGNLVVAAVSLWRSTSAINEIGISFSANNFASGSVFTIYGIKAE